MSAALTQSDSKRSHVLDKVRHGSLQLRASLEMDKKNSAVLSWSLAQ